MSVIDAKELKKGDRIRLKNGWYATIANNKRGSTTRDATVEGKFTETGSVYVHEIEVYIDVIGQEFKVVQTGAAAKKSAAAKRFMDTVFGG